MNQPPWALLLMAFGFGVLITAEVTDPRFWMGVAEVLAGLAWALIELRRARRRAMVALEELHRAMAHFNPQPTDGDNAN